MKLSDLRPAPGSNKKSKRVGRGHGSGKGKTSGRGMNGQNAREGSGPHRAFEGGQNEITRRLPFKRGVGFFNRYRIEYNIFNIGDLAESQHNEITPEILLQARLVKNLKKPIKILGDGEIARVRQPGLRLEQPPDRQTVRRAARRAWPSSAARAAIRRGGPGRVPSPGGHPP